MWCFTSVIPGAAIGWVGVIWLTPVVGSLLYYLLGINRIRRRASRLRRRHRPLKRAKAPSQDPVAEFAQSFVPDKSQLAPLVRLVSTVTGAPTFSRQPGPATPERRSSLPCHAPGDPRGETVGFPQHLHFRQRPDGQTLRGRPLPGDGAKIEVRVLIDDIGVHYSWPSVLGRFAAPACPRPVLARVAALALLLRKHAQPSQDHGRGRPDWFHRRHESQRGE